MSAVCSWLVYKAQQFGGTMKEMSGLSLVDRISNAFISYVHYLEKFFWPENLAIYYPHPGHRPILNVIVLGAILLIISISAFAVHSRKKAPIYLLVGFGILDCLYRLLV